jgi:hypothetical protein
MSDFHEQDSWEQDEVEIVDLGTPERGLSRYFFTLGEKWHAAASLHVKLVALVVALSLLIAVLQTGSSFVNNQAPNAPLTVPAYSTPDIINNIHCVTSNDITPGQAITLHQFLSTSSTQACIFLSSPGSPCSSWQFRSTSSAQGVVIDCSAGTPLPIPSDNKGQHP